MFLDRIVAQTRSDLEQRKREIPLEEVRRLAAAQPEPRDLRQALSSDSNVRLIAEVKRASPSKGLLAPDLDPVALARTYEANGAAAVSVLTEPHFFLGSPMYLTAIKQAVNIPVLRKDFIFDEYQVYEARAWGADAILLICAILDDAQLQHLLKIARELHMQCLVEVHSAEEARRAVAAGAAIIGINSRDLTTFQLHPNLIRKLRPLIPKDRVVVAESGIHTASDARRLTRYDVQAMLVGEALVVSNDVPGQMRTLSRGANEDVQIKICGLRTPHHLHTAIEAGADMIGLMFYEPSPRYIEPHHARELLDTIENPATAPDVVGVFVNKEADFIHDIIEQVGLDFVQLHGSELPEFCQQIQRPVIKGLRLHSGDDLCLIRAYQETAWRILLDTPSSQWGGSGLTHNWSLARKVAQEMPVLLAGGLTPENVREAISQVQPWGVDVSSGVETSGQNDEAKIRAFIQQVRQVKLPARRLRAGRGQ
ncbi:MAG TPA: bifunctional indole-3-glycerol-phosphate synthase TrpC/phosphoribosylanthranilate isomerase TrpF, partial [Ktedonobacteraceae bacterium]|nr:bifunctional indole-3-glycerol-phosphate synthase TrpC/phosphoribosylanthranilate isomerase TrpF [Ktedonobacteraceae bacterium]